MKNASDSNKSLSESNQAGKGCPVIRSEELFTGDSSQLQIEHQGELYTLRITSKGKLILTK
ncbi:hemin uptake protein HemP [Marinospirillum sp.]|uniref:hemin uptake protein HemP n=1 Tax=Marinospirillum sp. TaxID=2183934 RepID=UPI00384D4CD5